MARELGVVVSEGKSGVRVRGDRDRECGPEAAQRAVVQREEQRREQATRERDTGKCEREGGRGSPYLLLIDARRRHPPESLALARQVTHNRHHPIRTRSKSTNEVRAVDLCLATDERDLGRGEVGLIPCGCGSVEGCFVRCVRGEAGEFVLGQRAAGGGLCGCG